MVKTFKCPHGQYVSSESKWGVKVYHHEDGSRCMFLNKNAISLNRLNKEVLKQKPKVDSISVIASCSDRHVMSYILDAIQNDLTLIQTENLIRRFFQSGMGTLLDEAMVKRFGGYGVELIKRANVYSQFIHHTVPNKQRPKCITELRLGKAKASVSKFDQVLSMGVGTND